MVVEGDPQTRRLIYVVDDSGEMRRSLHYLLDTSGIGTRPFASAEDFLENIPILSEAPILLDLRMPQMDGLQLVLELNARGLNWPVVFMTAHGDVPLAVRAMKLGAIEFLEKPFEPEALEAALEHAFAALETRARTNAAQLAAAERFARLTARERDVAERLTHGAPNKIIARDLGLSARTVEMHRSNALEKLGVKSLAELIALYKDAAPPRG